MLTSNLEVRDLAARLAGKVALVTGGGRGIGAAIATELASQGAAVVIGYHRSCERAKRLATRLVEKGMKAEAYALNIGSASDLRAAFPDLASRWGALDILINNAGISYDGMIEDLTDAAIDEMLTVNVKGTFLAIKEALPFLRTGGRVVNIGSISSDYMPYPGRSLYVMTKSAVAGLTRGLARELAGRAITINNVQPGRVETEMLRAALGSQFELARKQTPLGRFGEPSDVAHLVAFLCGDEAGYVSGANLRVDGAVSV